MPTTEPASAPNAAATRTSAPSPLADLEAYIALPRLQDLVLSPDGGTLLVSVSTLNADRTGYLSSWWRVDPDGRRPARRYTRSGEGESAAAFSQDGSLLFTSARPTPPAPQQPAPPNPAATQPQPSGPPAAEQPAESDAGVLWCLPGDGGEAYPLARRDGGWQGVATARAADVAVLSAAYHLGTSTEAEDRAKRAERKKRKISAILHEGYPVRFWDHDLNLTDTRLFAVDLGHQHGRADDPPAGPGLDLDPDSDDFTDVTPGAVRGISNVDAVADDGSFALVTQSRARPRGVMTEQLVEIDLGTGAATVRAAAEDHEFGSAVLSDDGRWIACRRESRSTPDVAPRVDLYLIDRQSGEGRVLAEDWDRWPTPVAFDPTGAVVYAVADEDQRAPLFAVDVATGTVSRLTGEGAFGAVRRSPDGTRLYALRTCYTDPGTVVAIEVADGALTELSGPVSYPELPGELVEVSARAEDGTPVRGLLALPAGASAGQPAPLALWIHGGPLSSWNSWSWRWCPWLMVAQGWAVLLPDPALSTGYGQDFVQRGWARWGSEPYTDLMAITDAVEQRSDIAADQTTALGGSFGGYMANWVAGHTDRFRSIVSHASLWNLTTFGASTDAGWYWQQEMTPQMMAENSPHLFADRISTPMLVIHGDKDYRVPIAEGISLWWSLVSGFDGEPEDLPHKFLYFPDENHWVLSPQHAIVWYQTVLAFVAAHRGTGPSATTEKGSETGSGNGNFDRPETL